MILSFVKKISAPSIKLSLKSLSEKLENGMLNILFSYFKILSCERIIASGPTPEASASINSLSKLSFLICL